MEQKGPTEAYRTLQKSLQHLPGTTISLADVKLIGVANHIASSVRRILRKAGQRKPVVLREAQISNLAVEYAHIYPLQGRQRHNATGFGKVRLKSDVDEAQRTEETLAPLTLEEERALEQIVASGVSPPKGNIGSARNEKPFARGKRFPRERSWMRALRPGGASHQPMTRIRYLRSLRRMGPVD